MQKKIVLKFGSLAVTELAGGISPKKIETLVKEIVHLKKAGFQVVVVSSGAINSGKMHLSDWQDKMQVTRQQAASAIGQPLLMLAYIREFQKYQLTAAQILVTHDDFKHKERFINIRNTIHCLLNNNHIPIINENDTTSFTEITVGDNDQLAAMVTLAIGAEKLIILSETDGLYDKDPKDPTAKKISHVFSEDNLALIKFGSKSSVSRGGMQSKLTAIKKLIPFGVKVSLGSFQAHSPVVRLMRDYESGTHFLPKQSMSINHHRLWMGAVSKNDHYILVDEGAYHALCQKHKSLLPIGIKKVAGKFKRGDVVQIKYQKKVIAVGLAEYSSSEINLIKGQNTEAMGKILQHAHSKVAVHVDNLVIIG